MDVNLNNTETLLLSPGMSKIMFSWYDYALFILMLLFSTFIGIYFGCFGKKQSTADEYLLGGKTMKALPIAASLVSSHTSGIALLSIPADVYNFGATYILTSVAIPLACITTFGVYIQVHHKLQLTSVYEYLKLRFDTRVRLLASFLFSLSALLYLPIVIYGPALALAQATDINVHMITLIVCSVCVFYTTIGGLKAVVWTDLLQFVVIIAAMVAVLCLGIVSAGGLGEVFKHASESGRFDMSFDYNLTTRDTVWCIMVGYYLTGTGYIGTSQHCVQKFIAVPNLKEVKKVLMYFALGIIIIKSTSVLTGLIIYSKYRDCDPLESGIINKADQLLPYYVMDVAASIPGLPGLFLSGIFCASLSTLSAVMNSISATLYEDFISRFVPNDISQKSISNILKTIVVTIGVISTSMVFMVEHLGNLLPLSMKLTGLTDGPLIGIFTLGILFPQANAKGAFFGGIISLLFLILILIGAEISKMSGLIHDIAKPLSTEACNFTFTPRDVTLTNSNEVEAFALFRISHYYIGLIGLSTVLIVGLIVSWFTQNDDEKVNKDLLSPVIHRFLSDNTKSKKDKYNTINRAMHLVVINKKQETTK